MNVIRNLRVTQNVENFFISWGPVYLPRRNLPLAVTKFLYSGDLVLTKTESVLDEWSDSLGHCWTDKDRGKTKVLWEKSIQVCLCSLQISQGQPPNRTGDSPVRCWQISIDLYITRTNCCCCFTRQVKYIPKLSTKFHGTVYKPAVCRGQSTYYYFLVISYVNKLMCKRWRLERICSHPMSKSERLSNDSCI